ncbi:fungal-specific transcription factor domain-containing protein [Aspergillus unguis]
MSNLQPADIAYLDSQKCLHVPAGKLLETLVSHYFLYVHPCLPIVNEVEFWTKLRQREETSPTFSLLVFQAMLFAASSYIPLQNAKQSGAESILGLRDRLYRRAKLLYDFGLEDLHEDICLASLLLSYYCSKPDSLSNTTWLAVAIQHARAINAHLYHRYPAKAKHRRTKLKRIWWSLIIRDRVIALGMRRSLQILPSDFDVFSHPPLALEDMEDEIHASEVYDAHTKTVLCKVLTSQCQLAVALTPVLMTVYPGAGLQDLRPDDDTTWRRVNDSMARLHHWEKHHMVQINHETGAENPSIPFFQHLTALYYETARLALYHHISFCLSAQQSLDMTNQKHHPDLIDAIATINKTVKHFIVSGTAGWLPISAVAYTIAPQILLNINLRLVGNPADRRRQENLLRFYTELSRAYHLRYDVTYISSWIQQIVGIFDTL